MISALPYLALLPAAGLCYQYLAARRDKENYPPPGDLIDVGGRKLHIHVQGNKRPGVPTVIIETGIWDCSQSWQMVQSKLASTTRVCTYDRAGYGWSDRAPGSRSFDQMVCDLKTLLEKRGIEPPFIFVGHSLGGPIARYYQSQYPNDVVGMVFVDALHNEPPDFPRFMRVVSKLLSFLAHFGIFRLLLKCCPRISPHPEWTPAMQKAYIASHWAKPSTLNTCLDEWNGYDQNFRSLTKESRSLKEIPVTIISRDPELPLRPGMSKEATQKAQAELEKLHQQQKEDSPHAKFVVAKGSSHIVHLVRPDAIVDEVRGMVEEMSKKLSLNVKKEKITSLLIF